MCKNKASGRPVPLGIFAPRRRGTVSLGFILRRIVTIYGSYLSCKCEGKIVKSGSMLAKSMRVYRVCSLISITQYILYLKYVNCFCMYPKVTITYDPSGAQKNHPHIRKVTMPTACHAELNK